MQAIGEKGPILPYLCSDRLPIIMNIIVNSVGHTTNYAGNSNLRGYPLFAELTEGPS